MTARIQSAASHYDANNRRPASSLHQQSSNYHNQLSNDTVETLNASVVPPAHGNSMNDAYPNAKIKD